MAEVTNHRDCLESMADGFTSRVTVLFCLLIGDSTIDCALTSTNIRHWPGVPVLELRLGRGQRDVGHALGMQAQHLEVVPLVDQAGGTVRELVGIDNEGHQHAGAELTLQHQHRHQRELNL